MGKLQGDPRFSVVSDRKTLARLNSEPTIKVYRAMQIVDGKLYPPMAARINGAWVEENRIGDWLQADEHPELVTADGMFKLDKGNGKSIEAAYNPYWHTSNSPFNDQFSSAYLRPNLVVVEVEIPKSELDRPYWAKGAKDPVGEIANWHKGKTTAALEKAGVPPRKVILSRWCKINRIVPTSEVADIVAGMFNGTDVTVDSNVLTPALRKELETRGVKVNEVHPADGAVKDVVKSALKDQTVKNAIPKKEVKTVVNAALDFYKNFREKRIKLYTGGDMFFAPSPAALERHGYDAVAAWAEYALHQVTSDNVDADGSHVRVFNPQKIEQVLSRIEEIVAEDKVVLSKRNEQARFVFSKSLDGKHVARLIATPTMNGVVVDLAEVTTIYTKNKTLATKPLSEVVAEWKSSRGLYLTPATTAHFTISAPSRQGGSGATPPSIAPRASFAKRPFAFDGQPLKDPKNLYQQMNRLDDVSLYAAALACKMAVSGAKSVKESTVVEKLHDIYPDRKREDLARMAFGIKNRAEAYAKRIKEDLNRGVTESAIVKHIPDDAREAFAGEIRDEALRGRNLGAFGQRVSQEIRNRQAKVFADAVKVQTGMEASLFESFFGFDLASTIEGLANNPYLKRMELKDEERRKKRMEQKAAQKKDAAAQEETDAGEAEEDAKPELPALSLEDPHALAMKLVDMCREYWNAKHGFRKEYNPFSHAVALQFLRKTLSNIYSKLADDLVYSRMRETVRNHIAKLENCPTVRGIEGEATFLGQLINAKRIRQTAQELCEQLSTFLKTKFEASGQFDPAVEELKRRVPAVLQRMARYARHAIWLTPEAAMLESAELQKEIAAATQEFDEFDADSADSRIINENTLKLNVLREFGALKYKPIAQIEEAIAWWENAQDEGAEKIFNAWNEREKRTERIANILAAAFRNPSVKARFAKEGHSLMDVVNDYLQGHMGFINLLRDLMRFAPAAERAAAEEYLRQIELEIQKAGTRAETAKRNAAQELVRAAEDIYGKPFAAVLRDMVKVDERFMPFMGQVDNGKTVAPTKGRAMQLLASLLQLGRRVTVRDLETGEDVDTWIGGYWDNIVANGREGQAEKIAALLTVEDMNMLAWMRGWYERNRQSLGDISQRIFGVGVYAETGNYMPVKMLVDPQGLEKATSVGWSVFPKSLTPRVRNLRDFDTSADVFQMFLSRMHEAEQWKAHAELGLELRGIFGRSELQKALRASHGDKARRLLLGFITDILAGHGAAETGADGVRAFTDTVRGWAAVGALGGNLGVMLKQPTSIPAFAFEIGLKKTATFIASAFSPAGLEAMGEIWRSQERVNRWHGGYSEEIANALRDKNPGPLKKALLATMVTNRLGDVVPALVVGQGIYRDYLAQGYSKEDAMAATWILVERTQQSSRIENRAGFQRRHPLGNTIYQFLTTQQQYLQYEIIALREAINEPRNSAKWTRFATATVLNHFILSSAYFWMGQLYRALLGQPPPKEQLQDWVIAMLLGPYGALYGLGITSSDAIGEWVKGYKFGKGQSIPSLSFVGNIFVRDPHRIVAAMLDKRKSWSDVLDETGRWISDFNSLFRDARKVYRYRIKGEK